MVTSLKRSIIFRSNILLIMTGLFAFNFTFSAASVICSMNMEQEQCCCCEKNENGNSKHETISKGCNCKIKEAANTPGKNVALPAANTDPLCSYVLYSTIDADQLNRVIDSEAVIDTHLNSSLDIYLRNLNLRI